MKYDVIAIEREYASGGREIGQRLAEKLGIPCYSGEVLHMAAKKMGMSAEYVEHLDETAPNSLLYSLAVMAQSIAPDSTRLSAESTLQQAEANIIKELANRGRCVIIGRCAGAILRERESILRVFIYAGIEHRRKRAVELYGEEEKKIDLTLRRHDKKRADYYNFYSLQGWDDPDAYQMMLDSGKLGIERCTDIIATAAGYADIPVAPTAEA